MKKIGDFFLFHFFSLLFTQQVKTELHAMYLIIRLKISDISNAQKEKLKLNLLWVMRKEKKKKFNPIISFKLLKE
ncbi:MAG: hypothetical protein V2I33_24395 [Kangiellaceae bacterium]|jgi:hypothetical protein|nr:hypothetical protein [Kangiellaceae bacterium]